METRQIKKGNHLVGALIDKGIDVQPFDLADVDIGKPALALVLANLLKPKARYLSVVGSFGWGGKVVEQLAGILVAVIGTEQARDAFTATARLTSGDAEKVD